MATLSSMNVVQTKTDDDKADNWMYKGAPIPMSLTGYIHEFEVSNSYVIPFGIILIVWDYLKLIKFKWDQENKTKYATFLSDEQVSFSRFGIVVGDIILSRNRFKMYSYSIKIDKVGENSLFYGFVAHPLNESILDWNTYYCWGKNREEECPTKQFAVEVWHMDYHLVRYGGNYETKHTITKLIENTPHKLKNGDTLKVEVDFEKEIAVFYIYDYKVIHDIGKFDLIPSICAPEKTTISLSEFDCILR